LFGLLPIYWLRMGLVVVSSQILAKILANHWRPNPTPKNWLANFGKANVGIIQTGPYCTENGVLMISMA
jgi:hypothetical protein